MEWIAPGNKTYNQQQRPHFFKEMKELAGEPNHSIHQQSTTSKTNQIQLIDFPLLLKCWLDSINYYNSNCYIGTSYRGDTLSNSQFDWTMEWM